MNGGNRRGSGQNNRPGKQARQSGQNRQQYNGNNRPPLSEEEYRRRAEAAARRKRAEAERARRERYYKEQEKARRKTEFRNGLKALGGRLLVFLAILVVVLLVFGGIFYLFFRSAPDKDKDSGKMTYYYGGAKFRDADVNQVLDKGEVYFCFNDLADYIGFYESGSSSEMKFILQNSVEASDNASGDGSEEIIIFYTDKWKVSINGQEVTLDLPNKLIGEDIWVSSSFVEDYMNNISVTYDEKKSEVRFARVKDEENSDEKVTVYLPVSFKLKWAETIAPIEEDPLVGEVTYSTGGDETDDNGDKTVDLNFATDLSDYEKYMNPEGELRDAFLTLVNTTHTLTENDVPDDLMDVKYTSASKKTQQMREYACKALEALYAEMHAAGYYDMAVYSAYRTYSYQSVLFENYTQNEMNSNPSLTREEAEEIVLTYSTRPGTSEHQTGLAVDMDTLGTFTTDFEYEPEYDWLQENAWKFGFILRFPKDKVDITSIQFEPWHYRYVGRYHAQKIHDSGLCLEEYVEQLS